MSNHGLLLVRWPAGALLGIITGTLVG